MPRLGWLAGCVQLGLSTRALAGGLFWWLELAKSWCLDSKRECPGSKCSLRTTAKLCGLFWPTFGSLEMSLLCASFYWLWASRQGQPGFNGREIELHLLMQEWQDHNIEEHVGWEILLWPPLKTQSVSVCPVVTAVHILPHVKHTQPSPNSSVSSYYGISWRSRILLSKSAQVQVWLLGCGSSSNALLPHFWDPKSPLSGPPSPPWHPGSMAATVIGQL